MYECIILYVQNKVLQMVTASHRRCQCGAKQNVPTKSSRRRSGNRREFPISRDQRFRFAPRSTFWPSAASEVRPGRGRTIYGSHGVDSRLRQNPVAPAPRLTTLAAELILRPGRIQICRGLGYPPKLPGNHSQGDGSQDVMWIIHMPTPRQKPRCLRRPDRGTGRRAANRWTQG